MELRIDPDGSHNPPNQTHLVLREVQRNGRIVRHFLCLRCRELLVAREGLELIHECDGADESGQ
jgi:hypothetical protein